MSSDSLSNSIFLARQPIFDNNLDLFAYELLFRGDQTNQSGVDDRNGDMATSKVISYTFLEFGIDRVLDNKFGFINLTRAFLTGEIPLPFNPDHVVLEILEDIIIDEEIIEAVKQAVLFLGINTIKSWATIIAFSNIDSPVTKELLTTGLVRAKMSELIAPSFQCNSESAFMLGLFSIADTLFNKPMLELLKILPISEPIKCALLDNEGELGELLAFILSHERGSLTVMPTECTISQLNNAFITATDWADTSQNAIN